MKVDYIKPIAEYTPDGIYEFIKEVELEKDEKYTVNIYTSGRYILKINNTYVCEGPCKGHQYVRYYDSVETELLKKGLNTIKIIVMHVADEKHFTTVFKTKKPEVVFEAKSLSNVIVSSDEWKCYKNNTHTFRYARWRFLPPFEDIDITINKEEYPLIDFGGFDFEHGLYTFCGIANGQQLQKRPIPMLYPGDNIEFKLVKKGKDFIEIDSQIYSTAKISFTFAPHTNAKIIYAECYETDSGKALRDDSAGFLQDGYYDTVITSDTEYTFSPFWFRTFRFIRIEAKDIDKSLVSYSAKRWHYPVNLEGSFSCSDETYNKIQDISVNTMLCCTHDTFYDCPFYEQQQYEMDAAVEMAVFMRMTSDIRMAKKCLEEFAASQLDSGLLQSIYPSVFPQIIPGYSFFWIFMLKDYLNYSADVDFVKQYIPVIDKIVTHFESILSPEGLITKSRYWDFVDWVSEWDNGEPVVEEGRVITVYNMYFAHALLCAEDICKKAGRNGLASEYKVKYNKLADSIKKYCFNSEKKLYTDSVGDNNYSAHTIIWAIISELNTGDEALSLISHLGDKNVSKASFSMNYYLFRALEKCGRICLIFENMDGWVTMLNNHCTSWCEHPGKTCRSECHGWSSAPLYEFSSNILGIKTSFEDEIVIMPYTANLSFAKGTVPTRFGDVYVSWKKENSVFKITVEAPSGARKKLILPDGKIMVFESSQTTMEYTNKEVLC